MFSMFCAISKVQKPALRLAWGSCRRVVAPEGIEGMLGAPPRHGWQLWEHCSDHGLPVLHPMPPPRDLHTSWRHMKRLKKCHGAWICGASGLSQAISWLGRRRRRDFRAQHAGLKRLTGLKQCLAERG